VSQQDCLDWLKEQYKLDPAGWFRVKDVQEGLRSMGAGNGTVKNVAVHLLKLRNCGDIQMRGIGAWKHYKEFKAKKQ